jgi:hypothetical protein
MQPSQASKLLQEKHSVLALSIAKVNAHTLSAFLMQKRTFGANTFSRVLSAVNPPQLYASRIFSSC